MSFLMAIAVAITFVLPRTLDYPYRTLEEIEKDDKRKREEEEKDEKRKEDKEEDLKRLIQIGEDV